MFWQEFVPAMWEVVRLQKLFFAHTVPKQMRFFDTSSVGYMSSLWYRQIRHSGDAKGTCGIAVNALLISIWIFKCRWILSLRERVTGIILEADALSLPAGQMHTCNYKWHTLSLTHISRLHPGLESSVIFDLQVQLSLGWMCWLQPSKQGTLHWCCQVYR